MGTYRWVGSHAYRDHANDRVIEPGDEFEEDRIAEAHPYDVEAVDESRAGPADADDDAAADDVEAADPPVDPSELTVDELEAELDEADWGDSALQGLRDAEAAGKNRETALDAIDAARSS
jgi:hypothetical protein